MDSWCTCGMRVEVLLTEEGLAGSRYVARVIEKPAKGRALVEFEAFNEEGSETALLREYHKAENIQPVPPSTPDGFLKRLTHGDEVEVLHDDGWWRMTFQGTRSARGDVEYHVSSTLYQVERWVTADEVRPNWKRWGSKWRQLEQLRKPVASPTKDKKALPTKPAVLPPAKSMPVLKAAAVAPKPLAFKAPAPTALALVPAPSASSAKTTAAGDQSPMAERLSSSVSATGSATGNASPVARAPRPPIAPPPMTGPTSERCSAVLRQMQARDDAMWFAQPVRQRALGPNERAHAHARR